MNIHEIVENQRRYFETGATLPVAFRLQMLKKLQDALVADFEKETAR